VKKINFYNPWHKNPFFKHNYLPKRKRNLFFEVEKYLSKKMIISISGLRRMGKTTIMKQLIAKFLNTKIDSKNIFFYSFSETDNDVEKILYYYFNNICPFDIHEAKVYIFLDELQYVKNWQEILKFYYDLNSSIHFVISGSSSLYLHQKTKESLAGRIIDLKLNILTFQENLYLKHNITQIKYDFFENDFFEKIKKAEKNLSIYQDDFFTYLQKGEFPEIINEKDNDFIFNYLSNAVIDKIFNKDIALFEINKKKEFLTLYKIVAQNCAQMINKTNIAASLGINFKTITNYLNIQEKAFLIYLIPNYLRSIRSQEKSYKKVFIASINLLLNILEIDNFTNIPFIDFKGHLIENYVFNVLKNKYEKIFFYHHLQKEVDIVLEKGQEIIPLEIKAKATYKKSDLRNLINFALKKKISRAIFIYGGFSCKENIAGIDIYFLPYYFL